MGQSHLPMTAHRALNILNAASLGKGTGHVYTYREAAELLRGAEAIVQVKPLRRVQPVAQK
jgi:hypothetical protein